MEGLLGWLMDTCAVATARVDYFSIVPAVQVHIEISARDHCIAQRCISREKAGKE